MPRGALAGNRNAVGNRGRPVTLKYDPKYAAIARGATMLGATDVELAAMIGIGLKTLSRWKNSYPEFEQAIKSGKDVADSNVAVSLYRRAIGYTHRAVKIFAHNGTTFEHEYTERYPPETTACIFWLKNRRPKIWRDRPAFQEGEEDDAVKELLRAIRDSPGPAVDGAYHPDDIPVPAPS